jgi:hypothetical protein
MQGAGSDRNERVNGGGFPSIDFELIETEHKKISFLQYLVRVLVDNHV